MKTLGIAVSLIVLIGGLFTGGRAVLEYLDQRYLVQRVTHFPHKLSCRWRVVGFQKSHHPERGAWCDPSEVLRQLDLDGGGDAGGNYPVVGQAECCTIM